MGQVVLHMHETLRRVGYALAAGRASDLAYRQDVVVLQQGFALNQKMLAGRHEFEKVLGANTDTIAAGGAFVKIYNGKSRRAHGNGIEVADVLAIAES